MTGVPGFDGAVQVFDAVVLAGGRGSRLGGIDKATLQLDGKRLVDRALEAARRAGAQRLIAVGPAQLGVSADRVVREEPPFSGPLSAVEAALSEVQAPWLMLLACDLVHPTQVAEQLGSKLDRLPPEVEGIILVDDEGRRQWLAGCYQSDALRAVLRSFDGTQGKPLASAISRLRLREIAARPQTTNDIDTPDQLAEARTHTRKATP